MAEWPEPPDGVPAELLGYRSDPKWRDMSDFLVHFTDSAENFGSILVEGRIRPSGPFGWGRSIREVREGHRSACFSEIPLDLLDRLMGRHGHYGIGFRRDLVTRAGGARVWYLEKDSRIADTLFGSVGDLLARQDFHDGLWALTPFIDNVMQGVYEFEWEREWRVPGGLNFDISDVAFVLVPGNESNPVLQDLSLPAPVFRGGDPEPTWWAAIPDALGDAVDKKIATFLSEFQDPIGWLPLGRRLLRLDCHRVVRRGGARPPVRTSRGVGKGANG